MSVDCRIMLPGNVRIRDVANVIGILCGKEKHKVEINGGRWYLTVDGVTIESSGSLVECSKILINAPISKDVTKERKHQQSVYVMWHWEPTDSNPGGRLLMPPSTPFWIAVGIKLVDFFSGAVDYNDCDDVKVDYCVIPHNPNDKNCPGDGEPWRELQQRMWDVPPLTTEDFDTYRQFASYK